MSDLPRNPLGEAVVELESKSLSNPVPEGASGSTSSLHDSGPNGVYTLPRGATQGSPAALREVVGDGAPTARPHSIEHGTGRVAYSLTDNLRRAWGLIWGRS